MLAIINAELVMRDRLIPKAVLFIENDKIAGLSEIRNTPVPTGWEILDAEGAYLDPGLMDIHVHTGAPTIKEALRFPSNLVEQVDCTFSGLLPAAVRTSLDEPGKETTRSESSHYSRHQIRCLVFLFAEEAIQRPTKGYKTVLWTVL